MIIKRAIEIKKDLYLCYTEFQKNFDTVKHETMMKLPQDIGKDVKDMRIIGRDS